MRGLTIIACDRSVARLRTAIELTLAQAALGGPARLFISGAAVSLIRATDDPHAGTSADSGNEPPLADMIAELSEAGVMLILCQTGMAVAGMTMADAPAHAIVGGMISVLAELGDDRLITV